MTVMLTEDQAGFMTEQGNSVRLCKRCLPEWPRREPEPPACLACTDIIPPGEPVLPTPCADPNHHLCLDCCLRYVPSVLPHHPTLADIPCPCGAPLKHPWSLRDVPREVLQASLAHLQKERQEGLAQRAQEASAPAPPWTRGPLEALRDHASMRTCPRCGLRFDVFDGCAAITCPCGCHFCGLCFLRCETSLEAHRHVAQECTLNTSHPGTYYVPLEDVLPVWESREKRRLDQAVRTLAGPGMAGWLGRRVLRWLL